MDDIIFENPEILWRDENKYMIARDGNKYYFFTERKDSWHEIKKEDFNRFGL